MTDLEYLCKKEELIKDSIKTSKRTLIFYYILCGILAVQAVAATCIILLR